ncbi:MAG: HEAT repeat domain-containing protein [Pyrinomonadaceae bacterium]|nr:HEAT repeat domain-containing protein [Pyrinomonadaceae bacterium]
MRRIIQIFFPVAVVAAIAVGAYLLYPRESPEAAFERFLSQKTDEAFLVLPLCGAGPEVVPLVVKGVKDPNLPKRRYALAYLGISGKTEALPVLKKILGDTKENDVFRADALEAIHLIDEKIGTNYAKKHSKDSSFLGRVAKEVLAVKHFYSYRQSRVSLLCNPVD